MADRHRRGGACTVAIPLALLLVGGGGLAGRGGERTGAAPSGRPPSAAPGPLGVTAAAVEERTVRTGGRQEGAVEVLEGVRPGELVATSALAQPYDGPPVAVATPRAT